MKNSGVFEKEAMASGSISEALRIMREKVGLTRTDHAISSSLSLANNRNLISNSENHAGKQKNKKTNHQTNNNPPSCKYLSLTSDTLNRA